MTILLGDTTPAQLQNQDATALQAGVYGTPGNQPPNNTVAITANRVLLARFTVPRAMTIVSGGFAVTSAAGSNDNVMIGIYDSTCANLLASSTATASKLNGTGNKIVSLQASVTLTPGNVYYSAFVGAVATSAASIAVTSLGDTRAGLLFAGLEGATASGPTAEVMLVSGASVTLPTPVGTTANSASAAAIAWRTV